jgi:hypothetical protein
MLPSLLRRQVPVAVFANLRSRSAAMSELLPVAGIGG